MLGFAAGGGHGLRPHARRPGPLENRNETFNALKNLGSSPTGRCNQEVID
jgi:hypothetical protein